MSRGGRRRDAGILATVARYGLRGAVHTHCYRTRRHLRITSQLVSQPHKLDIVRGTRALQALATSNPDADEAAAVGGSRSRLVPVVPQRERDDVAGAHQQSPGGAKLLVWLKS